MKVDWSFTGRSALQANIKTCIQIPSSHIKATGGNTPITPAIEEGTGFLAASIADTVSFWFSDRSYLKK